MRDLNEIPEGTTKENRLAWSQDPFYNFWDNDTRVKMKLHALKGVELPGKVPSFYSVPLDPALKGEAYGALAGQGIVRESERTQGT